MLGLRNWLGSCGRKLGSGLLERLVFLRTAFLDVSLLWEDRIVVLLSELAFFLVSAYLYCLGVLFLARRFCAGFTQCTGAVFLLHDFHSIWIRCVCGYNLGGWDLATRDMDYMEWKGVRYTI